MSTRATYGGYGLIGTVLQSRPGSGLADIARRRTFSASLGAAAMLFVILFSLVYAIVKPDYNWDMVAYVGAALEDRYDNPGDLHKETWRQIDALASPSAQAALKFGDDYRKAQWETPENFESQLSMYRVKTGYIALLRAFEPFGGVARGSMILGLVASSAFGALCFWILWRERSLAAGLLVAPVLLIADYSHMTSSVSPDLVLSCFLLAGLYALLKGREVVAVALLLAAVAVRPDGLIFVFALLLAAILFGLRWLPLLVAFVASFALVTVMQKAGGHIGWWPHFWFSNVQQQHSLVGFHPDFSLQAFAIGYARGLMSSIHDNEWPALLVLLTVLWVLASRLLDLGSRTNALIFAMAIGALGKFASFPLGEDRFYFPYMACMALIIAISWPRIDETMRGLLRSRR